MFIGREKELQALDDNLHSNRTLMISITGRRRIGKSRLAEEFARKFDNFYEFSGLAPKPEIGPKEQKQEFIRILREKFSLPEIKSDDWGELFSLLSKSLNSGKKNIILFDEISWMAQGDKTFLPKLKNAWDLYFKKHKNLVLILCGSVSHWIEENILKSTGFVGRISYSLRLKELSLQHCAKFWKSREKRVSAYDKLKILSITGGIPRYLEEINPKLSAEENIANICFRSGAFLLDEFEKLFSNLFKNKADSMKLIAESLVSGAKSYQALLKLCNKKSGGSFSEDLDIMISAGFVARDQGIKIEKNGITSESRYRLSDNYVRFYLKYLKSLKQDIESGIYSFKSFISLHNWETIFGLQFENLVLNNQIEVLKKLNIDPTTVKINSPYYQKSKQDLSGVQIDYLVMDKYNTIYLCEIKTARDQILPTVIEQVQHKIQALNLNNKSIRPVLIYAGNLHPDIKDLDYFDKLLGIEELFSS